MALKAHLLFLLIVVTAPAAISLAQENGGGAAAGVLVGNITENLSFAGMSFAGLLGMMAVEEGKLKDEDLEQVCTKTSARPWHDDPIADLFELTRSD